MLEIKNIYKTFNPGTINEKLAKTPVPTAQEVQPVGVEDIIAKMF